MPISLDRRLALLAAAAALLLLIVIEPALAQAPRRPFGLPGGDGPAGPPADGLTAWLLAKQAEFSQAMAQALRRLKDDGNAIWTLLGIGLAYGVFHAAGPGHGKAVIASYIVADGRSLPRGFAIALAAAALQGLVAVAIVGGAALALGYGAAGITRAANWIEAASFAAIALLGLWLTFRKGRALWRAFKGSPPPPGAKGDHAGHVHMPDPEVAMRLSFREAAGAVIAAGARPCTGAILVLVFALAQGLFWAGIAAVAAISLGTAMTTGAIAVLAVYFKIFALKIAGGRGRAAEIITALIEFTAALAVLMLGGALALGYARFAAGA